jgi:superfamily II RNA helicase
VIQGLRTDKDTLDKYRDLHYELKTAKNKQRNRIRRELETFEYLGKSIVKDFAYAQKVDKLEEDLATMQEELTQCKGYAVAASRDALSYLKETGLVTEDSKLTEKGLVATHIQEIDCIIAADVISNNVLDNLTPEEIAASLSIFAAATRNEPRVTNPEQLSSKSVVEVIQYINNRYEEDLLYDLCDIVLSWCRARTENECRTICDEVRAGDMFIGDFVKALLKINSIAREIGTAAELLGNLSLVQKLSLIPELTLKYLVSNQSIYI